MGLLGVASPETFLLLLLLAACEEAGEQALACMVLVNSRIDPCINLKLCMPSNFLLLQTYVLPSAMNCCQSWGPDLLNRRDLLPNDLQKVMLSFYRSVLGVRTGVPSSCLFDEVGAVPLQSCWLGACLKFWNGLLISENLL
jgi:hypothetical protein